MSANLSRAEPAATPDLALLVARILLVVIFPISGYYKLVMNGVGTTTGYFTTLGIPVPELAAWLAIGAELVLPVLIILGIFTRWAALGLILYVIGTIVFAHRFWEISGPAFFGQIMAFTKNLSLIAGLLLIAVIGPGRIAVSR